MNNLEFMHNSPTLTAVENWPFEDLDFTEILDQSKFDLDETDNPEEMFA